MMNEEEQYKKLQEFLIFCKESEKDLKRYHKKIDHFKKKLFSYIVNLTYKYYPEALPESENRIRKEIQHHYLLMIDSLDAPLSGFEVKTEHLVDYPLFTTNLEEEIADLNNEYKKYGFDMQSEDYVMEVEEIQWQIKNEKFRDKIINKTRKIVFKQFPEIADFSSNSLRELDYSTKRFAGELVVGINFIVVNEVI
jgi:hypothetical protein